MDTEQEEYTQRCSSVVRVDRLSGASFPVKEDCDVDEAEQFALIETQLRLPEGDKFLVVGPQGDVIFEPD